MFNSLVSEGTIEFSPQLSSNVSSVKVTLTFWVTNAPILFLADRIRIKLILTIGAIGDLLNETDLWECVVSSWPP